eukprot:CAMPEP_0170305048 /NCGR_PEP_ID=MMETSP0116_2-20130129/52880_1 /TAXON_ID=400756 /ORGANISM="Durinskia baltica, Strain CSIRO CS-38" /LENGTH=45 /DNA_ID= /DNA_START= /DNA_END= /DNA_ORIENTATION=
MKSRFRRCRGGGLWPPAMPLASAVVLHAPPPHTPEALMALGVAVL